MLICDFVQYRLGPTSAAFLAAFLAAFFLKVLEALMAEAGADMAAFLFH